MKNWQDKSSSWPDDGDTPDTRLNDDLVRHVVARTQQRVLLKDILDLLVHGFGSILLGLLGRDLHRMIPPSGKRKTP